MRGAILAMLFALTWNGYALVDYERQQIEQRIKPVGQVRLKEQPSSIAVPEKKEELAVTEPGKATFERYCAVCHRVGLAGAPKIGDIDDWKPRLAANNLEQLTASAIKGKNAMPPKGTCIDCSETDIKNAIQYMLPKT